MVLILCLHQHITALYSVTTTRCRRSWDVPKAWIITFAGWHPVALDARTLNRDRAIVISVQPHPLSGIEVDGVAPMVRSEQSSHLPTFGAGLFAPIRN